MQINRETVGIVEIVEKMLTQMDSSEKVLLNKKYSLELISLNCFSENFYLSIKRIQTLIMH